VKVLDYINIPFHCVHCQKVEHILDDIDLSFHNRIGKRVVLDSKAEALAPRQIRVTKKDQRLEAKGRKVHW
jgi:hypothetical protein